MPTKLIFAFRILGKPAFFHSFFLLEYLLDGPERGKCKDAQKGGYHVNPKSLGYRTCTYVGIKLEKGSMYKSVVAELQKIPEIVECHFTTGPYTMLTKLYACDNEHLMDLLNNKMQEIPGVVATETLISLEQSIKKEIPIRVEK